MEKIKAELRVKIRDFISDRKVAGVSLGPHIVGLVRPKSDSGDCWSQLYGALYRVCREPFRRTEQDTAQFRQYVAAWLKQNLKPIDWTTDVTLEPYLRESGYPLWRKEQIRRAEREHDPALFDDKFSLAKCFIKNESYQCLKAARWIMSRGDSFKALFGPFVHFAEKEVYKNRWFAKHLTPAQKMSFLSNFDRVGCLKMSTDHSAFEAAFVVETQRICEDQLFIHLYSRHPQYALLRQLLDKAVIRPNHLVCDKVSIRGVEARMSGDNHTSLGNGFANFMAIKFCAHLEGIGKDRVEGLVEGDDSIFVPPVDAELFKRAGFSVKSEISQFATEAGFCGLIGDIVNGDAITDPGKVLLSFGWTSRQYLQASDLTMRALIRAKALSLRFLYPCCPVLTAFFNRMIYLTRDVSFYKMLHVVTHMLVGDYERSKLLAGIHAKQAPDSLIRDPARELFSYKYSYCPTQQRRLENLLSQVGLSPIVLPGDTEHWFDADCRTVWETLVVTARHSVGSCPVDWRRRRVFAPMLKMLRVSGGRVKYTSSGAGGVT